MAAQSVSGLAKSHTDHRVMELRLGSFGITRFP